MLKGANLGKEIFITVKNEIGVLSSISKILADHGINIEALSGHTVGDKATITLLTDDNLRAKDALKGNGFESAEEREVVVVDLENKPGALKNVTSKLAAESIDINYNYCTICPKGCPARMVISTNNNEKALLVLKK